MTDIAPTIAPPIPPRATGAAPPAASNAPPSTIPGFDKMSFAQRRLAQDQLAGKVR
jgi:hypothetical protein